MSGRLDLNRDGAGWPHRACSRMVRAGGLDWHVQRWGASGPETPTVVLLHGTGASTHSWRDVAPLLAEHAPVLALDYPSHGFTRGRPAGGMTLTGFADAIAALLNAEQVRPALLIGHSAGAAVALDLVRRHQPGVPVVALNPALSPFPGVLAPLLSGLAKGLLANPLAAHVFALTARGPGTTERFLERATGSRIDAVGVAGYARLFGNAAHCEGALAMMANWNLAPLADALPQISAPVLVLHGSEDRAVPLAEARRAAANLPQSTLVVLPGLGHLAHEENPALISEQILRWHGYKEPTP